MANKRIVLSSTQTVENKLVYADLDISAIPSSQTYLTPVDEKQVELNVDTTKNDRSDDQMTLSFDDDSRLLFQTSRPVNPYIDCYNNEQRKRSRLKLTTHINVKAVQRSIHNIFSWTPGERVLNPEFGSNLRKYLYEGITPYNTEQIMAEIRHCFDAWEPRAKLEQVINRTNVNDVENNTVVIDIVYSIPSLTNEQYMYRIEVEKPV